MRDLSRATNQANSYRRWVEENHEWQTMIETETPGWFVNDRYLLGRQRRQATSDEAHAAGRDHATVE